MGKANPYRYIQIQGKISNSTTEGGHDMVDKLAKHYLGQDKYPYDPERKDPSITYTITPERFVTFGFE